MLDKMRPHGYVRDTTDGEAAEFGRGYVAVLDDTEIWLATRDLAQAKLEQMKKRPRVFE